MPTSSMVDGDPSQDLSVLADPARITAVWQAGVLVKGGTG